MIERRNLGIRKNQDSIRGSFENRKLRIQFSCAMMRTRLEFELISFLCKIRAGRSNIFRSSLRPPSNS